MLLITESNWKFFKEYWCTWKFKGFDKTGGVREFDAIFSSYENRDKAMEAVTALGLSSNIKFTMQKYKKKRRIKFRAEGQWQTGEAKDNKGYLITILEELRKCGVNGFNADDTAYTIGAKFDANIDAYRVNAGSTTSQRDQMEDEYFQRTGEIIDINDTADTTTKTNTNKTATSNTILYVVVAIIIAFIIIK